jgi:hypothetical protein
LGESGIAFFAAAKEKHVFYRVLLVVAIAFLAASKVSAQSPVTIDAEKIPAITLPGSDVPKECAAFIGGWAAKWEKGGYENWLWVTKVDSNCLATNGYQKIGVFPSNYRETIIKNGELSFICNRSTGGTCIFTRVGDDLSVSYSNPSGGTNSAIFKRIQITKPTN